MRCLLHPQVRALGLAAASAFVCAGTALAERPVAADVPAGVHKHLGTAAQRSVARRWNGAMAPRAVQGWNVLRPFSEFEKTGFVAISDSSDYELPQVRLAIARGLPKDAQMIVYVESTANVASLKATYEPLLGPGRLKFVLTPLDQNDSGADPDWARDASPFPVYLKSAAGASAPAFGLVASIYPQDYDPNGPVDAALGLPMIQTNVYFRGGNLLFDERGNCFAENVNEVADLKDPVGLLTSYFGCTTVTLLDQSGGIGDIDERLKFLGNNVALTDDDGYAAILSSKGYEVRRIPRPDSDAETYMNTLLVNGTIFVPQMGNPMDADALQAYAKLGLTPVGVYTKKLAHDGDGNIHCVTMNYPPGAFVASSLGPDFVEFAPSPAR